MAILKIARMGNPVLGGAAEPVADPGSEEIRQLIAHMMETLEDAGGVGLAAPQVHAPVRVVVFYVPRSREDPDVEDRYRDSGLSEDDDEVPLTVLINPEFEPLDVEEPEFAWEGCLSIPGMTGLVPRHKRIVYRGIGLEGEKIERQAEGFHARVVQHELDHLDGVLFPMRMPDLKRFGFSEEMRSVYEET